MAHSKLPWKAENVGAYTLAWGIVSEDGRCVVEHDFVGGDDAEFIVRAVNAHEELVAALKDLLEYSPSLTSNQRKRIKAAEAAIAKAEAIHG